MLFTLLPPTADQRKHLERLLLAVLNIEQNAVSPNTIEDLELYSNAAMLATRPTTALDFWNDIQSANDAIKSAGEKALPLFSITKKRLEDNLEGYSIPDSLQGSAQEYKSFPENVFPDYIERYIEMVCRSQQVDRAAVASGIIGTMAAASMGKFWVRHPDRSGHHEHMALYIVVIQSPSQRKSAALAEVTNPIFDHLKAIQDEYKRLCADAAQKRHAAEIVCQELDKKLKKAVGDDEQTKQAKADLSKAQTELNQIKKPSNPYNILSNVTPEALAEQMAESNELALIASAEAATFQILAGLYNDGKGSATDLVNNALNAEYTVIRRAGGRQIILEKPLMTILQYVQPDIYAEIETNRRLNGSGFIARILKNNIPDRKTPIKYINDVPYQKELYNEYAATVGDLYAIERPNDTPKELAFSDDAKAVMERHIQPIYNEQVPGGRLEGFETHGGKLPGYATRIAVILHLLKYPCTETQYKGDEKLIKAIRNPIDADTAESACKIAEFFLDNLVTSAGEDQRRMAEAETKVLERIVQRTIYSGKAACSLNDLKHSLRNSKLIADFSEIIEALTSAGYIELVTAPTAGKKGKMEIYINPYLAKEIMKRECAGHRTEHQAYNIKE